jgi:hypothetical protein
LELAIKVQLEREREREREKKDSRRFKDRVGVRFKEKESG